MTANRPDAESGARTAAQFATTRWSVVLAAGDSASPESREALEQLCHRYWYPLYAYVRQQGCRPEDAEDLTQDFFAAFLEKGYLDRADPKRGRFRTFLLASMRNFLRNARDRSVSQKRGRGRRPISWDAVLGESWYRAEGAEGLSPEKIYAKRWAGTLLRHVFDWLREDFGFAGRDELFDQLRSHLWGEEDAVPYARLGTELGMTPVAVGDRAGIEGRAGEADPHGHRTAAVDATRCGRVSDRLLDQPAIRGSGVGGSGGLVDCRHRHEPDRNTGIRGCRGGHAREPVLSGRYCTVRTSSYRFGIGQTRRCSAVLGRIVSELAV